MQRYNLRLSDKEYEDMKKMSALTERSINDLIREAIREYVEKKERDTKGFIPLCRISRPCLKHRCSFPPCVKLHLQGFSSSHDVWIDLLQKYD